MKVFDKDGTTYRAIRVSVRPFKKGNKDARAKLVRHPLSFEAPYSYISYLHMIAGIAVFDFNGCRCFLQIT